MTNARLAMGIIIFMFFFSIFLASLTGTTYQLLSPITLTLISVPLVAVIAAANTPIVKGTFMAAFFAVLIGFFAFSAMPIYIFGLIIVPLFIGLGLALADIGSG